MNDLIELLKYGWEVAIGREYLGKFKMFCHAMKKRREKEKEYEYFTINTITA